MSIRKGTTPVDYQGGIKDIEEKGAELENQIYKYLYGDINEPLSREKGFFVQRLPRNNNKIVINAYEREMKKLGLNPNTKELIKKVKHDQQAQYIRLCCPKTRNIYSLNYEDFKIANTIIENKFKYINKKINGFEVSGVGDYSICLIKNNEKTFHWFSTAPLKYPGESTYNNGLEVAKALIRIYGE